jgi:hypothetical protein
MLQILEMAGIALGVLLLLYLLSRRFPSFGDALAFVCVLIARLLVKIQWFAEKAAGYLDRLFQASLNYPPGAPVGECFAGIAVLARVIYLAVSLCIFIGETENTLLAQSALWQTSTSVQLPGGVELASATLFLCTAALFGAVLLETVGLIPASASLFVPMRKLLRWIVGIVAGLFTVVSLLVVADFYLFRGVYLIAPSSAQPMTLYILGGLGLITAAASIVALWGLVVGTCGLLTVVFWLFTKVYEGIAEVASLLPSLLDVLALFLSDGRIGVYSEYLPTDPYKVPGPLFNGYNLQNSTVSLSALPEHTDNEQTTGNLLPEKVKEEVMKQPFKTASVILVGSFGSRMFPLFKTKIAELDAAGTILTTGLCDLSVSHMNTGIPSIIDLSPDNADKKQAVLHNGAEFAAYATLLKSIGGRLVEVHLQTKAAPAPLLFVIDKNCLASACSMVEDVKRRLPLHSIVVITSIVQADLQNTNTVKRLQALQALHEQEVLEKIIVLDARSPFALQQGEETQLAFTASALISLLLTHKHTLNNRACNEMLKELHIGSAFASFSFASETLALGKVPARLSILPGVKNKTGMGDLGDILAQVQEATKRCVEDRTCAAFPVAVDSASPAVVVVDTPIKIADARFHEVVSTTSRFVNATYPFAACVTVSGNGCCYPKEIASRFFVQASCLYQLPNTLSEEKSQQKTTVIQLLPLPAADTSAQLATNGNGHKNGASGAASERNTRRSRKNAASVK